MTLITEEQIEEGLRSTILAALPYLNGRQSAVQPYAGETDMIEALIPVPAPCVRFYLGDFERDEELTTFQSIGGRQAIGILVITASYLSPDAARAGEYGNHRISRDVRAACHGSNLGIAALMPLDFKRRRMLKITPDRTAYLMAFETSLELEVAE